MNTAQRVALDLAPEQIQLQTTGGALYWRSLHELIETEDVQDLVQEAAGVENPMTAGLNRRRFLSLIGASLALAGLSGCFYRPKELILPYVRQPEGETPGNPLYFATAMPLAGYGNGLLIKSMTGRPIKAEGNPDHPTGRKPDRSPPDARFGPTDVFSQASLLSLYDPDRSQTVVNTGNIRSWDAFVQELNHQLRPNGTVNRELRIRILTETVTSPSLAWQIERILNDFPQAKRHVYEPAGQDNQRNGLRQALGRDVAVQYDFRSARVVLSLDADFLASGPGHVRYASDFSWRVQNREPLPQRLEFVFTDRLYMVESMPTVTGSKADHRKPLRAAQILSFARALATRLGVQGVPNEGGEPHGIAEEWMRALVDDLNDHRGLGLILAGPAQPPLVHALAHAMNQALGNIRPPIPGAHPQPVIYTEPVEFRSASAAVDPVALFRELIDDMAADPPRVDMLIILGGNPAYTAPADFDFRGKLFREVEVAGVRRPAVPFRVHLSEYRNETSELCHWHIPQAHYLESWGDVRAFDGTVSIIQPLIAPLFGGKTAQEVLDLFMAEPQGSAYDIIRTYWGRVFSAAGGANINLVTHFNLQDRHPPIAPEFEDWWRKTLHDGVMERTASPPVTVPNQVASWPTAPANPATGDGLEIVFKTDPTIFDGRFANNGWLQELPKPISKLTWDNAAFISPATAIARGFAAAGHPEQANGKVVRLRYQSREVEAPLLVQPGHADDSITVHLGYGRTRAGNVGSNIGFNAYRLRTSQTLWFGKGLVLEATGQTHALAFTQRQFQMEGREPVRAGTVAHPPHIAAQEKPDHDFPTLYANDHHPPQSDKKWGMAIDLTACTGCSACIIACQSENNIPVVGKEQVIAERVMHWLRVDTYYRGTPENPEIFHQPVPCMQCENAPCELVCPVEATQHSDDGLNDMVYNRCVGTRYCSNNCPYKVRRFNFLQYADIHTDPLRLVYNPEVTVRSRGVMEKCTYCVQRIRRGEIIAAREDRPLGDGEIMTACQAACPAGAITFGDLNQQHSRVKELRQHPLTYGLLNDLNTRPRTSYLAAIKNPNSTISPGAGGQSHE
jgi:molybdopterin-containing oxidoreductase family iron-sulfur binding subunit